ncbi:MAG: protein kinase [Oscillospiraceae bacterium]|nr:protein kinase [Oscillospiraceae bacterium]
MSELMVSPLLDAMEVGECFASHDGVSCYNIRHPESGREFVLKHISVPATQDQVEALLLTGAYTDKDEADAYYRKEAEGLIHEAEERKKLLDCPYILPFLGVQMEKKEEGVGYDVYAVLPKRNSLQKYLEENAISHLRGINMGIDLCVALAALREEGYVHGNLKPGNVFFSDSGRFLLGDFGLISTQDMQYAVLPEQYRSSYTAPELRNFIGGLNTTVDIYSLGMILYRIYNGNHAPFEDEQTPSKAADTRRLEGDTLPAPLYADYELAEIIQKACAYNPEDRYQTPDQMRVVLEQYMRRNAVSDHLIVPPLVADEGPLSPEEREEVIEPVRANDVEKMDETFKKAFAPNEKKGKGGKKDGAPAPHTPAPEDQTPLLTSERRKAAEKARKRRARRRKAWIAFGLLMVLLVVGIGLYEFTPLGEGLYHYFVTVERLEAVDVSVDSVTLDLKASVSSEKFTAHCEDAFGNAFQSDFKDGKAVFTGLNSGTQYTLRVTMDGRHKISGKTSVIATTLPQAEVLSFNASAGSQEGSVQLSLLVKDENVVPSEWVLRYGKAGEEEAEQRFTGLHVTVDGLEGGSEYTFRLVETEELPLGGTLETVFTAPREILAQSLRLDDVIDGTALISWRCTTEPPAAWELACTDEANQAMEISVDDPARQEDGSWLCSASVLHVIPGTNYTLKLNAPDCIFQPMTLKFNGTCIKVDGLALDSIRDGDAYLSWHCSTDLPEQWILTCSDASEQTLPVEIFADQLQEQGHYCSAAVRNLIPGTPYTAELYAVGMSEPLTVEILDSAYYVDQFTARLEDGAILLDWAADRQSPEGWTITVSYGSDLATQVENAAPGCSVPAVPETAYTFTLAAADGSEVRGENTVSITTPAAERFTDLGIPAAGTTIGTYYTPTKENWTERDLGGGTVRFRSDDSITFRIAVTGTPADSEEEVTIQYVIRDGSDRLVHVEERTAEWNSLWDGKQWMEEIPWLPETPGSYSFTVLVNGKRMGTINFSIVN